MEIRVVKEPRKGKYRSSYDTEMMANAIVMVREQNMSVERAAKSSGVPVSTLKDRIRGRVGVDVIKSGPAPLFSLEEENQLVDHINTMAEIGYGYTRTETLNLASDFAVHLGYRNRQHPLSLRWLNNFLSRWPNLSVQKARSLEAVRAKCTTRETVSKYFAEMEKILIKYNLKDRPERIYNVDEKGLSTDYKPPNIIAGTNYKPQVITTGKTKTVTMIGSSSAIGNQVPPYFIFPGQRMIPQLLEGATAGVEGTVSESGWSNTDIFQAYMKGHLIKQLPARDADNKVLVLYDGHKSHVSMGLISWAKEENIILFVLPPHTSHILQPLDVGVFGPFEVSWRSTCHQHLRQSGGSVITRYDVCKIACSVYTRTLTSSNIQSAFRKCGIYPFNPEVISNETLAPSLSFPVEDEPEVSCVNFLSDVDKVTSSNSNTENNSNISFFDKHGGLVLGNMKIRKARKTLSKVVGGRPITEENVINDIERHYVEQKKTTKQVEHIEPQAGCSGDSGTAKKKRKASRENISGKGNSRLKTRKSDITQESKDSDLSSDEEITEEEKCCVCVRFSMPGVQWSIVFTKWVQCDKCPHWVHVQSCTPSHVIRRGDIYICPHCKNQ